MLEHFLGPPCSCLKECVLRKLYTSGKIKIMWDQLTLIFIQSILTWQVAHDTDDLLVEGIIKVMDDLPSRTS